MSEERALADRLSGYGDAVAAFSLVNTLGFFAAIAEVETRCALADHRGIVVSIIVSVQLLYAFAVMGLRRMEMGLRDEDDSTARVRDFRKRFYQGRLAFVIGMAIPLAILAWIILRGESCKQLLS